MKMLALPSGQMLHYANTGKFVAPSAQWQHQTFTLTDYELFVLTEGTLYLSYNNENFTVSEGQYLLLPPSTAMREGFRPGYCAFYWLHFTADSPGTPPHEKNAFLLPQTGTIHKLEKMVVLMKQLQDSVKNGYPPLALNAMTTCVLTELYGQLCQHPQLLPDSPQPSQKQIYSDIVDYIRLHIAENISVTDVAAHFGYNAKYLSHLFAEITGSPLKQFILKQKIDSANYMLTDTNLSIAEIAKALGFSDSHNFSRTYKRMTDLTPSEYRNAFAKRLLYHV